MKRLDLLIFDLDGTLVRSGRDIALAVNHALATLCLPAVEPERIEGFVGDGLRALLARALGGEAERYLDQASALFVSHYGTHLLDHTALYPDVAQILDHFAQKRKVIVTNKRESFAVAIVKGLGIGHHFLEIIGEDTLPYKKPDRRLLDQVMARWGSPPERTCVIGDGVNDILLAKGCGAVSCAFLNGLTKRERLLSLNPDLQCEHLSELAAMIV